jgi:leader peptidase (prepilin peptidase) / N-methyltransferase
MDQLAQSATAIAVAFFFVLGLLIGSFLNVVVLRSLARLQWQWRSEAWESVKAWYFEKRFAAINEQQTLQNALAQKPPSMSDDEWIDQLNEDANWHLQSAIGALPGPKPAGFMLERSHCPKCGHGIRWYENVPLISWLALRGKCSACKNPISFQYPLVELITGLVFAICFWHFGFSLQTIAAIIFSSFLIVLTTIDFKTQLLPDQMNYPLLWIGLALACVSTTMYSAAATSIGFALQNSMASHGLFVTPVQSVFGALFGYLSLWSVFHIYRLVSGKEGMGYGDFKLLAAMGAWLGVAMLPIVIILASVSGAIVGSILLLKNKGKSLPFAFGPYLAMGGWLALIFGDKISTWYLSHLIGN